MCEIVIRCVTFSTAHMFFFFTQLNVTVCQSIFVKVPEIDRQYLVKVFLVNNYCFFKVIYWFEVYWNIYLITYPAFSQT